MIAKRPSPNRPLVRCPHCGWEYLPCEVFMPGDLIGKSETVIRDALGKIIYEDYKENPELTTHFVCEHCEKPFIVDATTTFKTKEEEEELDFSSPYASLLD